MGISNYVEQKAVIEQSNEVIDFLGSYADSMNLLIINVGSLWDRNYDQCFILYAIANCVALASDIEYDYDTFSVNAIKWLNQIDALEKIVKAIIPGKKIKRKPFVSTIEPEVKLIESKVRVDWQMLVSFSEEIRSFDKKLDGAQLKTAGINSKIDKLILEKFSSKYSLSYINKRIKRLQKLNLDIANRLYVIACQYRDIENELNTAASMLLVGGEATGEINATIMKTYTEYQQKGVTTIWPVAKEYSVIDINDSNVFVKQSPKKCTLASNVMMMRRAAILRGDDDWESITEGSTQDELWSDNGMANDYNSNGFNVKCYAYDNGFVNMNPAQKKQHLIELLEKHPEGVVIYDWTAPKNGGGPHAILLTDYTDGTFYAADPAGKQERVPVDQTLVSVEGADQYWVIE